MLANAIQLMRTKQVNIRLSEDLLKELDSIADDLHITKSEWVKMRLAEAVQRERHATKHAKNGGRP